MAKLEMADFSKCQHTYCPCDEGPHGIEKRDGSGDDSECKICEFEKLLTAAQKNKAQQLCNEDENFIQTKFGYCFYTLDYCPLIYNLYVHPQYRHCGHSRELLELAIGKIRKSGYEGKIRIWAEPKENSIGQTDLEKYYKSMGLTVCEASKAEKTGKNDTE